MEEEDNLFVDAPDDFPFYDCVDVNVDSDAGADQSLNSPTASVTNQIDDDGSRPQHSSDFIKFPASNLQRRSQRSFDDSGSESLVIPGTGSVQDYKSGTRGRRYRRYRSVKQQEKKSDQTQSSFTQVDDGDQSVGDANRIGDEPQTQTNEEVLENVAGRISNEEARYSPVTETRERIDAPVTEMEEWPANVLIFLVQLIIKATWFQVRLFMGFVTFPIWSFYYGYMFVLDPIQTARKSVNCAMRKANKVWGIVYGTISPYVYEWLKDQTTVWKLALQFAWGFLWAVYVCIVLCVLLVWAFVASRVLMNSLVEEPVRIVETLHFDYTQYSPVAYVPVAPAGGVVCGGKNKEMVEVGKSAGIRTIPPNQEMQVEVLLTLPESDYNRNLGMFQVRVDFLSASGKVLASISRPCMLQYKSQVMRLILTVIEMVPLATGYLSESQTVHVKMRGFPAGDVSTTCLRVIIEQRAEFRPGGGIPEIYTASLVLESALPFFKRLLWCWRKTLFIWVSLMMFITELTFGLLCCRPMILPRLRARNAPDINAHQDYHH
ncbi:hypothetical protein QQ045_026670 [Rhodiola kirilowii]